jgi:hypothetical protein
MVITPPMVVPAPEPRGLRYGLFTAANGPINLPTHALAGGITYEPVSCGFARSYDVECPDNYRGNAGQKTFDSDDDFIERETFIAYATIQCGTAGKTDAEIETRVRRRLANGEQTIAESGMAAILAAGATPLTPPGTSIVDTVGELEQWLYGNNPTDGNYGNVGYLHASPRIAAYAANEDLIVQDGPLLRTRLGTIWVFGGGYPDDGMIYVSGQVTVWWSPDMLVPSVSALIDRQTNQRYAIAEREYAVSYDCVAASAQFNWGIAT